jgi:acyl-CoA thioester hydrolase
MNRPIFELSFTAEAEHIDELGHVNNAVWVQWMEQVAVSHWRARANPDHQQAYVWIVVRHEIDYLRAAHEGERITARTWAGEAPQGARFDRHIEFIGEDGKLRVRARSWWAVIDREAGKPVRVPADVIAPFISA